MPKPFFKIHTLECPGRLELFVSMARVLHARRRPPQVTSSSSRPFTKASELGGVQKILLRMPSCYSLSLKISQAIFDTFWSPITLPYAPVSNMELCVRCMATSFWNDVLLRTPP